MNQKYQTGITFGVFDGLHMGHINLLKRASERCEKLIVAVSSDAYVQDKKGKRPIMPLAARIIVMECLPFVDTVIIQAMSYGKKDAVAEYKPDVIFVGDDWKGKDWDGAKLGVTVEYLPRTKGISSTDLQSL